MNALVTGAAGFIGSHLSERLLDEGWQVKGVDSFSEYYDRAVKQRNLEAPRARGLDFVEDDLTACDLGGLLDGVDAVFHLAGQPGVRGSWGDEFRTHVERNIMVTQRLLEGVKGRSLQKFVFASSSSVYGNIGSYPTPEDSALQPVSPYGVSKLSAEKLCLAYGQVFDVPVVALRYFTVYGPRQRPDMAFNRFISALEEGREITVFGDGSQRRDFTFVADTVDATFRAAVGEFSGGALNVGGGGSVVLSDVLSELSEILDRPLKVKHGPKQPGDVEVTGADITQARRLLGYEPRTSLADGLRAQAEHQSSALRAGAGK